MTYLCVVCALGCVCFGASGTRFVSLARKAEALHGRVVEAVAADNRADMARLCEQYQVCYLCVCVLFGWPIWAKALALCVCV